MAAAAPPPPTGSCTTPSTFSPRSRRWSWYSVAATARRASSRRWSCGAPPSASPASGSCRPPIAERRARAAEWAHVHRKRLRPVGSALSPNGAAFNEDGMISLALLDEVLEIDEENMTVTTQAGARVAEVPRERGPFIHSQHPRTADRGIHASRGARNRRDCSPAGRDCLQTQARDPREGRSDSVARGPRRRRRAQSRAVRRGRARRRHRGDHARREGAQARREDVDGDARGRAQEPQAMARGPPAHPVHVDPAHRLRRGGGLEPPRGGRRRAAKRRGLAPRARAQDRAHAPAAEAVRARG